MNVFDRCDNRLMAPMRTATASSCTSDVYRCLNKTDEDPRSKAPVKPVLPVTAPVLPSKAGKGGCKLEVPPKLVFSMLKDRELTSKLRALRLPTDGKRQVGASSGPRQYSPSARHRARATFSEQMAISHTSITSQLSCTVVP